MMRDIPASAITTWRIRPEQNKATKTRVRAWASKTRTGCITCKKRRVKCDEIRPDCARCIKYGVQCEGYSTPQPWLFPTPDSSSTSSEDSELGELIRSPSPWPSVADMSERRALNYWMERTQPELATFTYAAAHFWTNLVPQMYRTNSTIRSAVIAASALHEETRLLESSTQIASKNSLYLKHYSNAVHDLIRPESTPSREVILMSCLIFMACENLRGSAPGVLIHLKAGLKLLREWRVSREHRQSASADSASDMLVNFLEPLFARLEAQVSFIPFMKIGSVDFQTYDLHWKNPVLPARFDTLADARNGQHDVIQHLWFLSQSSLTEPIHPDSSIYHNFLFTMTAWDTTFTSSFPRHTDPTWKYYLAAKAIRLHFQSLHLAFRSEGSGDPMYCDAFENDIHAMLDIASDIIIPGKPPTDISDPGNSNIWDYDFCIGPPLLEITLHCRDPLLRRRAVHLMRLHHCWYSTSEPYDACAAARMADCVIEVEERRARDAVSATDPSAIIHPIAPQHRIRPLRAMLDRPGKLVLQYSVAPHTPEMVMSEEMNWPYWTPPPIEAAIMFPLGEMVKHGNFVGMLRPVRRHCLCKSLGSPPEGMREPA